MEAGRKYTKRLLPESIWSESEHGPINKATRSAGEQAALEKRKNEILQSLPKEAIEAEYSGMAVKINKYLSGKEKRNNEIDSQIAQLKDEHDMEMRVIKSNLIKQDERREADAGKPDDTPAADAPDPNAAAVKGRASPVNVKDEIKGEDHEEGEIAATD